MVLVNSAKPYGSETAALVEKLEQTYHAVAMAVNCNQLRREDVLAILEKILSSFPVRQLAFHLPKWVEMLPQDHWLKQELVQKVRMILGGIWRSPVMRSRGFGLAGSVWKTEKSGSTHYLMMEDIIRYLVNWSGHR